MTEVNERTILSQQIVYLAMTPINRSLAFLCKAFILLVALVESSRTSASESGQVNPYNLYQRHHSQTIRRHSQSQSTSHPQNEDDSSEQNTLQYHRNSNAIARAIAATPSQTNLGQNPPCPTCGTAAQHQRIMESSPMPEETLRRMRLEMVKKQILKKLRLEEPPQVPKLNDELPTPLISGETLHKQQGHKLDRDLEDFYGKTEQVIILPEESQPDCPSDSGTEPSACFNFKLPKEIRYNEIEGVELWSYKLPDPNDAQRNQTLSVSVLSTEGHKRASGRILDIKSNVDIGIGWLKLNITSDIAHWLRTQSYEKTLQITCKTCAQFDGPTNLGSPIGTVGEERPFIVINMAGIIRKKRSRRDIICSEGVTECCRERFVVNFKEIGWDNWIIHPSSFETYFCKGTCNDLSSSQSTRTSILGIYINNKKAVHRAPELALCCTATRTSSIHLSYRDGGANSTVTSTRAELLPNMVVESCGCL